MKQNSFDTIRKRIPYGTLGIEFYDITSINKNVGEFEDVLEQKISRLKRKGVEIGNYSEYFGDLIEEHITRLLGILETKHLNNKNVINNLFRKRASDEKEFKGFIGTLEEEIAETEVEYNYLKEIYDKENPLKKLLQKSESFKEKEETEEETEEEVEENE